MSRTRAGALQNMTPEEARRTIIKPYMTEKTFNLIEGESKIVFIVDLHATKKQIKAAIKTLYEMESEDVNTMRSIRGKKAIVKFAVAEKARELATTLGLV
ncbi:MAG: 50S ribosomal protein L23 [Candidatus Nitrosopolaris sp.]|jgi:large subunit ribosomal protein L23